MYHMFASEVDMALWCRCALDDAHEHTVWGYPTSGDFLAMGTCNYAIVEACGKVNVLQSVVTRGYD